MKTVNAAAAANGVPKQAPHNSGTPTGKREQDLINLTSFDKGKLRDKRISGGKDRREIKKAAKLMKTRRAQQLRVTRSTTAGEKRTSTGNEVVPDAESFTVANAEINQVDSRDNTKNDANHEVQEEDDAFIAKMQADLDQVVKDGLAGYDDL